MQVHSFCYKHTQSVQQYPDTPSNYAAILTIYSKGVFDLKRAGSEKLSMMVMMCGAKPSSRQVHSSSGCFKCLNYYSISGLEQ